MIKLSFIWTKHQSKSTAAYLANKESETGIKCTPFNKISVKSPDASLIDFCTFVYKKEAQTSLFFYTNGIQEHKRTLENGVNLT